MRPRLYCAGEEHAPPGNRARSLDTRSRRAPRGRGGAGAAWRGGDLVYGQRLGVTHALVDGPDTFTPVADASAVPEGAMRRIRHDALDLLLVRQHGQLCALAHSCSHLGGPLSEGALKEGSVVCPWHGSEFALADGRVINGPATHDQPCLDVRERN